MELRPFLQGSRGEPPRRPLYFKLAQQAPLAAARRWSRRRPSCRHTGDDVCALHRGPQSRPAVHKALRSCELLTKSLACHSQPETTAKPYVGRPHGRQQQPSSHRRLEHFLVAVHLAWRDACRRQARGAFPATALLPFSTTVVKSYPVPGQLCKLQHPGSARVTSRFPSIRLPSKPLSNVFPLVMAYPRARSHGLVMASSRTGCGGAPHLDRLHPCISRRRDFTNHSRVDPRLPNQPQCSFTTSIPQHAHSKQHTAKAWSEWLY